MRLYLDTNILVFLICDKKSLSIARVPVSDKHLNAYAALPFVKDHRDPYDRMIISQAISDKAILVSSDLKFPWYSKFGLNSILNDR